MAAIAPAPIVRPPEELITSDPKALQEAGVVSDLGSAEESRQRRHHRHKYYYESEVFTLEELEDPEIVIMEVSLPCCICCPIEEGLVAIAAANIIGGIVQLCSVLWDAMLFPLPFLRIGRAVAMPMIAEYAVALFYVSLTIIIGFVLLVAACRLSPTLLRWYVWMAIPSASFTLSGYLYLMSAALRDPMREVKGKSPPVPVGTVLIILIGMVVDLGLRMYALLSALKLFRKLPHHGPFCTCIT